MYKRQDLVGGVAGQCDLEARVADGGEERVGAQGDGVRVRLAQVPDGVLQQVGEAGRVDLDLVVRGARALGRLAGEVPFVEGPVAAVGDVEGVHRPPLGGQGGHQAGVEAAGGDDGDRHVGDEQPADLLAQAFAHQGAGLLDAGEAVVLGLVGAVHGARGLAELAGHGGGRGQDPDAVEEGLLAEGGLGGEVGVEPGVPDAVGHAAEAEQGRQLGGEVQRAGGRVPAVVQRLHADVVGGQQQPGPLAAQVHDGEGVHAV